MTRSDDVACRELVEIVTAYLDDALEPDERARLEHHLTACDGCQTYVEQMRLTIRATAEIGPEVIPPEGLERLLRVYHEYRGS